MGVWRDTALSGFQGRVEQTVVHVMVTGHSDDAGSGMEEWNESLYGIFPWRQGGLQCQRGACEIPKGRLDVLVSDARIGGNNASLGRFYGLAPGGETRPVAYCDSFTTRTPEQGCLALLLPGRSLQEL